MPTPARTVEAGTAPAEIAQVLREDGCVIVAGLVAPELMDRVTTELAPYIDATAGGRTDFLGHATRRTGALIARSPTARSLMTGACPSPTAKVILGKRRAMTIQWRDILTADRA